MGLGAKARSKFNGIKAIWRFDNRLELIARRVLFPKTGIMTYRICDMEIVIDHHAGDETGTRECLTSNLYLGLIRKLNLPDSLTVFDIGANGGGFPLMLAASGFNLKKLGSIEMNPRTFGRMYLNVIQNLDCENVLINAAICGVNTTLELSLGQGSTGESISGTQGASSHGKLRKSTLEGISFNRAFERAFGAESIVDICKFDVEGTEYDVFAGENWSRLKQCRYLIIEIHDVPGKSPEDVIRTIEGAGFQEVPGSRESHEDVYLFENNALPVSGDDVDAVLPA